MSRGNGKKRLWRVAVLIAGVMTQLGLCSPGQAYAQGPLGDLPAVTTAAAPANDARAQAKTKLSQARARLGKGDFDGADALAKEVAGLGVAFGSQDDSPTKVQRDLAKARTDPKALLEASRAALGRGDLGAAEKYARASDKCASLFTFPMWADSPAKVLKDIHAARKAGRTSAPPTTIVPARTASDKAADTEKARALLKKAREAMASGKKDEARALGKQAAELKANLGWADDNPERLLADLDRAPTMSAAKTMTADSGPKTKADAVALLAQGRKALAEGKVEEASSCAEKARGAKVTWGLFDDTPEALQREIAALRGKRDRHEAARLLAEGRALHAKGDFAAAEKLAYRSQTLYNGYGAWDMGDRPSKLLADCQAAQTRARRTELPPAKLAQRESPLPPVRPPVPASRPDAGPNAAMAGVVPPPAADPNKLKARQLVAEAQRLHAQGDLMAARQKATAAQALRVAFAGDETSPDLVYQQLAGDAGRKVDALCREAASSLSHGRGDHTARARAAEAKLGEARALAAGFLLDTRAIDDRLAGLQPATIPAPGGIQQTSYPPATAGQSHGQELLAKARVELQKGEAGTARKMAELALTGNHGVKDEAMAMLRSIDKEEFNQKKLATSRAFDAAEAALRRGEQGQAAALLASIDGRMLDQVRQTRLREINMIPGLASAAKKQPETTMPSPASPSRSLLNDGLTSVQRTSAPVVQSGSKLPGRAVATDKGVPSSTGGANMIDEYKQRQTALFQMMRQKGLEAQSQAAEKFRTGQHQAAIDLLDDYLSELDQQKLDGSQASLLRKPVESRKNQFGIMKSQKDLAAGATAARNVAKDRVEQGRRLEDQKRKNVEKLMREFNALFREHKFMEAEGVAMQAREIDPDNEVVTAAIAITRNKRATDEYKAGVRNRQELFRISMNQAEDLGPADALTRDVSFDKTRSGENRKRSPFGPQMLTRTSPKEKDIERKLMSPVSLNFEATPLKQVIDDLRDFNGINIVPDMPALQTSGISLESPVTIKLDQVSLKSALNLILHQVHLTYVIKEEVLQITTEENAKGKLKTVTYQVADLVVNLDPAAQTPPPGSPTPNPNGTSSGGMPFNYAPPSPITGPQSLTHGTPVGTATGGGISPPPPTSNNGQTQKRSAPTNEGELIRLLTNSISPKSWSEMGGAGTIEYHPLTLALVINQTPDIQEQIQDLLTALRRLQDQTVSIEVRMITVSEEFFERIGVNFAMNILTDKTTKRFEPTLLSGNFVSDPLRFINNVPKMTGLISGVTPAGSLTPTLDIPITQQSFYQTFPQFGNYTGGGLNVGLAFLSDIQVFLFMEALQGDTRANVMQAPKVTCANGQTALVQVGESQSFLTSVSVTGLPGGQFAFVPVFTQNQNQVTLSVTPLITDDRRFVRMSLAPQLQSILPGPTPVIPVTVPIFTNLTQDLTVSQPVVFTQYVQTPRTAFVSVQTEVRIPDGGTVVMGGLKRLAEARSEFGPPVLSKIPYINRLFKNVGYGRETESLLIMVTARIIVLAEEEVRATGFDSYANSATGQ